MTSGRKPKTVEFRGEQKTYAEISEITGVHIGTLRTRDHHGRDLEMPPKDERLRLVAENNARATALNRSTRIDVGHSLDVDPFTDFEHDYSCQEIVHRNPDGMRLERIAKVLGCTRQRTHQIFRNALNKLERRGVSKRDLLNMRDDASLLHASRGHALDDESTQKAG